MRVTTSFMRPVYFRADRDSVVRSFCLKRLLQVFQRRRPHAHRFPARQHRSSIRKDQTGPGTGGPCIVPFFILLSSVDRSFPLQPRGRALLCRRSGCLLRARGPLLGRHGLQALLPPILPPLRPISRMAWREDGASFGVHEGILTRIRKSGNSGLRHVLMCASSHFPERSYHVH
jgi:hypothetical protein